MSIFQRTIRREVQCTGIGLHSGEKVNLKLKPADPDTGICFVRADLPHKPRIQATLDNVIDTRLATSIGVGEAKVCTIEHLMAAIVGMGIDNVEVEVDAPEIPIMDGSAAPFIFLLKSAEFRNQRKLKSFILIKKPLSVTEGDKKVTLYPSNCLKISYFIDFDHPLLKEQHFQLIHSVRSFEREISRARTFGFLQEVEHLKKNGLALGGSLDNAVVIGDFRVLNEEGLRYKDEFVRHKILDFIGDMSLLGKPIIGHFVAHKSGHTLNHALLAAMKNALQHWEVVQFPTYAQYEKKRLQPSSLTLPSPAAA
jgi:UDP-3-O-[3-hydroxymyristoyl] N-acetylglucosamine deacetylase